MILQTYPDEEYLVLKVCEILKTLGQSSRDERLPDKFVVSMVPSALLGAVKSQGEALEIELKTII